MDIELQATVIQLRFLPRFGPDVLILLLLQQI